MSGEASSAAGLRRPGSVTRLLPLLLTSLAGTACAGGTGSTRRARIDTLPSGRIVVRNPARGTTDLDSAWQVRVLARIGSREGGTPASFGRVIGLALDPLGRVWVADGQAKEVRVFDPDGSFVRTVGHEGGGPGEFKALTGISRGPAGRMWVMDPKNTRITVFDTAGRVVSEHKAHSSFFPCRCGFFGGSRWFQAIFTGFSVDSQGIVIEDSALTPVDTLPMPSRPGGPANWTHTVRSGGKVVGMTSVDVPFAPRASWTASPDGHVWVGLGSPYRLVEIGPAGDTLREIDREYRAVPVSGAERDSAIARLAYFTKQGGTVHPDQIPDHKPAIRNLLVDSAGYLWVRPFQEAGATPAWDVFDPRGSYLGALHPPVEMKAWTTVVTGDRIVTVVTDDLGVPYVIVMSLDRGAGSPPR
ncbi:MAG: 6-bladed beta-propeller [Candidatus Palauibacterales bacterium]|nr:6-bladed beta-propeller [Candidatus Palauibacterales bacterium]